MKTYTIEQIRKYLLKQDSFGDVMYNLSEEKMDAAQIDDEDLEDIEDWSGLPDD